MFVHLLLVGFLLGCLLGVTHAIDLRPNCGFPGKPYRGKMSPEEKLVYSEGESVTYSCTDYWAAPQVRKCVNGVWTGPPARCGDFVGKDILMKDSQYWDMSGPQPVEMAHHTDMVITETDWKYPNAFTSNRFRKARLRIDNDHEILWKFNFTKPVTKLYVKMNFNFINFTTLPEEIQKAHKFHMEVEISPHRTCVLDYQNRNLWRQSGIRIDTYFVCEAHNIKAIQADIANPPNYMTLRTKSSHNISHEFVALFFGRVYGTDKEPLCGEPELDYGQSFRANVEHRDYIIDCANKEDWVNVAPDRFEIFSYFTRCIGDMVWNGTAPRCVPKRTCSLDGVFKKLIEGNSSTTTPSSTFVTSSSAGDNSPIHASHQQLTIDSIVNYYHFIDNDTIYATPGTEITYSCGSDDYILLGKEMRKCRTDRTWTGSEPTCKFIKSTNELIESSNTLLIVIVVMGILLFLIISVSCLLFALYTKRLRKKQAELRQEKANMNNLYNEYNMYDNIEMSGAGGGKDEGLYEVYERLDDYGAGNGNEYTPYNDQGYTYAVMNDARGRGNSGEYGNLTGAPMGPMHTPEGELESDYVRMLRESRAFPPQNSLSGGRVTIMRGDSRKKRPEEEPSYLEISK